MSADWAAIYEATYLDLVHFLYRKVWDAERASDLAQETFVRALGTDPENPRSWLFTVAANLARDEAREAVRRRRHLALVRTEASVERDARPDPLARVVAEETGTRVRKALQRLGERDREVLLLWQAGLSYAEIAGQTGLSPGAIGTTLSRARRRLVQAYETLEGTHVARG